MSLAAEPLDTTIQVVTPEQIAFRFQLAGPFTRFLALVLDTIVVQGHQEPQSM